MPIFRLLFLILLPVVFAAVPTAYFENGHSLCLIKNLFGVECPGCGMTRALSALLHGNLVSAVQFNRAVVIVGPLLGYTVIRAVHREVGNLSRCCSRLVAHSKSVKKHIF